MTNLLKETLERLEMEKYTPADVAWVGSRDGQYACSWEEFAPIAEKTNYDDGYGSQEVATDLVIVMNDGTWYERQEYDGSEGWRHIPKTPTNNPFAIVPTRYARGSWDTLHELHERGSKEERW